jgi:hypothetical protein
MLRRSFLKGVGVVTVGLLFRRQLDGVLAQLESESAEEAAIAASQAPAGAVITSMTQGTFHPERLFIAGTKIGTEMVPAMRFEPCSACGGDRACEVCDDAGGRYVDTGTLRERDVYEIPWMIDEFTIDGRPQFEGSVPGDMFASNPIDTFVLFETAGPACEIKFRVRYTGDNPEGEPFYAGILGMGLDENGRPCRKALPFNSGGMRIAA